MEALHILPYRLQILSLIHIYISGMKATATLKAADRNPYSWNMEFYEYPDGSGYEGRFTKCGICVLMKKLGLYDLTPVSYTHLM